MCLAKRINNSNQLIFMSSYSIAIIECSYPSFESFEYPSSKWHQVDVRLIYILTYGRWRFILCFLSHPRMTVLRIKRSIYKIGKRRDAWHVNLVLLPLHYSEVVFVRSSDRFNSFDKYIFHRRIAR